MILRHRLFLALAAVVAFAITTFVTAQMNAGVWRNAAALPAFDSSTDIMVITEKKDRNTLSLRYKLPELTVRELTGDASVTHKSILKLGNAYLRGNEGIPRLPVIPVLVVIPYGMEIASIEVTEEKISTIKLSSPLVFGKASIPLIKQPKVKKTVPAEEIYNSNEGFPSKNNTLVGVHTKRGVRIGIINLHPVTYFPKELKVEAGRELLVDIQFKESKKLTDRSLPLRALNHDLKTLGVENPEELRSYKSKANSAKAQPINQNQNMLLDPSETYQYVVITSEAIRDAETDVTINDLINMRSSKNITATLVTIERILSDYTGVDDAEKVRNFIIDAHTNWETMYVVLGGDVNIIPVRDLYVVDDGGVQLHSDLYYQCLDGSFNGDGDEYWGETTDGEDGSDIDLFAEVYVGRISAETPEEMSNAVYKIMAYEQDDASEDYLQSSCMVGEVLGSHFGPGEFGFAYPYMQEIKNGSSASGYTTVGFAANNEYTVDSLYDWIARWPVDSAKSYINSNRYSIINHLGHANVNYVMKMNNEDTDNLKNDKFMFLLSQGCFPGNLTADCIAERLTTSSRSGIFAGVFNSSYGFGTYNDSRETLDGASQRINRQFWDAFFGEYIYHLGAVNADSHEDNVWDINGDLIRYCIYETNLFGCPMTMLRGQVEGASLMKESITIDDSNGGNGDKIINPEETVEISIVLKNTGNEKAPDVTAVVSVLDDNITVTNENLTFGDIECCGGKAVSSNEASITISEDCPTPYSFPVTAEVLDKNGNSWIITTTLTAYRTHTIQGIVRTLTDNNPIAGATVSYEGSASGSVTTNDNGEYTINGIEGSYELVARAEGYLESYVVTVTIPPSVNGLDFNLGRPVLAVDPVEIKTTLEVNETDTIPLIIENVGDMDLLVTPSFIPGSITLAKGKPTLIKPNTEKNRPDNSYLKDSGVKKGNLESKNTLKNPKTPSFFKPKVLYVTTILGDPNLADAFVKGMRNLENIQSVDVLNGEVSIPDLSYLQQYDVVVVASNYSWADPVLFGNTLADYVDAGGSICLLVGTIANTGGYGLGGKIITDEYLPLKMAAPGRFSENPTFAQHEITEGLTKLSCDIPVATTELLPNGISLGTYSSGYLVGACHNSKPILAVNVFPMDGYWQGDLIPMMENTVNWYASFQWISIEPNNEELLIPPGESSEISVFMSSVDKMGGIYQAEIALRNNDPQISSILIVPVELTIDGFKSLSIAPNTVDFGQLWLGLKDTVTLTLTNNGTEKCIVNSINSDNLLYSVSSSLPLSVYAGKSETVDLIYTPDALGFSSASITVLSDAEDNGSIVIPVTGDCTPGPEADLDPSEMSFHFESKDPPADKTAVLSNIGEAPLSYIPVIRLVSNPSLGMPAEKQVKKMDINRKLIYSHYNYRYTLALDRVIVAFKQGKSDFAQTFLAGQLGSGEIRELAKARIPGRGVRAYTGRKLIILPLSSNTREGVIKAIEMIREDKNVAYVEPDYRVKAIGIPDDEHFDQQYALHNTGQTGGVNDADVDAPEAWDITTGKKSDVILGILDTGIDYYHPDLVHNIWTNINEIPDNNIDDDGNGYIDDVNGYDFAYSDNDPMDVDGHGTHCSGIAAAEGNNGANIAGVSWGARLMAIKILDDYGYGYVSDIIDGIAYGNAMGATILSASWGGGPYSQSLYDIIEVSGLFVAAAGNSASDADRYPHYPSSFDLENIISVAATDHKDDLAYFSNYGIISVDIGAPGVDILSTIPNDNLGTKSGTSMSTPLVAGCAVLLKDYNPFITTEEIKEAILSSAEKITALDGKCVTGGRLNVAKAVEAVSPPWISLSPMEAGSIDPHTDKQFTVTTDPKGLVTGEWIADVVFQTNDPFKSEHLIRVTVDVAPCKTLSATEESTDFGEVWVDRDTTVNIILVNDCNAPVTIQSLDFSSDLFTSTIELPLEVPPFGNREVPVTFAPKTEGNFTCTVDIESDAEDNPILEVVLHGDAVWPPNISVKPEEFITSLELGEHVSEDITLTNSGGADYYFKVKRVAPPEPEGEKQRGNLASATVFVSLNDSVHQLNIETGEFIGKSIAIPGKSGWDEGMAFDGEYLYHINWSNIVTVFNRENGEVVRTIECEGSDYGFDGLGITSDYLVLGAYYEEKIYVCDKETGKLVTSWDNPYYGGIACSERRQSVFLYDWLKDAITEHSILDGAIIQETKVDGSVYGLGYSESAEVLIASMPWYEIQILDIETGDVVANHPIKNVYAIAGDEAGPDLRWLSSDIKEGIVPAGGSLTFTASMNSSNRLAGTYNGTLEIQHVFPFPPGPYGVYCSMTVLPEKHCRSSHLTVAFTDTWLGRTDTFTIYLKNAGNEETTVKSLFFSRSVFSTPLSTPLIIPPFDSVPVPICFTPWRVGRIGGNLLVKSDAEEFHLVKVSLIGTSVKPPNISYTPDSIGHTLETDITKKSTINLLNTGGADYTFDVNINKVESTDKTFGRTNFFGINYEYLYTIDPENGTIVNAIKGQYSYDPCASDGKYLFVIDWYNNSINIYDPSTGEIIRTLSPDLEKGSYIYEIGLSDQYLLLLVYSRAKGEYSIGYYDINDGTEKGSWKVSSNIDGLSNGKEINTVYLYNYWDETLETRKISNGELIKSVPMPYYGYYLSYSQSMDQLLISRGGYVHTLVNPETGVKIKELSFDEYMLIAADESGGVPWLKADVRSATVPAKGSYDLSLTFNSERIPPGTYKANIEIVHFKEWEPGPFLIPCELTILPNSSPTTTSKGVDFGNIEIGSSSFNE